MVTLAGYILMFALIFAAIYLIIKFNYHPRDKDKWKKNPGH